MNVVVLGSTGYSGTELIKILLRHPKVDAITCHSHSLGDKDLPAWFFEHELSMYAHKFTSRQYQSELNPDVLKATDVLFSALPHAISNTVITPLLQEHSTIGACIDLSHDYRMQDGEIAKEINGRTPIYGLCEWNRSALREARFVANPGCYATASLLALLPLLRYESPIAPVSIVALSGVSGAGRGNSTRTQYVERADTVLAYKPGTAHAHWKEIRHYCAKFAYKELDVLFTPVMVPMKRGIAAFFTLHYKSKDDVDRAVAGLESQYLAEQFVTVLQHDDTRNPLSEVSHGNYCAIRYTKENTALLVSSYIDNLVKGAAGQAIQNFNIMHGYEEHLGLITPCVT